MPKAPSIPRPEYPRPQFVRRDWLCLNGPWQFEIDQGDSGLDRGLLTRPLKDRITVPFCPESKLSGIGNTDYLNAVWYRRDVAIPAAWKGRRILLHFQTSDYDTFVWANGTEVGRHRGGMTPFTCDLTDVAVPGKKVTLVVRARDNARESMPSGKQSWVFANSGCHYTRTTGIWQTVWLEPVPLRAHLLRPKITPDVANRRFCVEQPIAGTQTGLVYHPDGILTAPSDAALVRDIKLSQAAGFNGARLHQKVFRNASFITPTALATLCGASSAIGGSTATHPSAAGTATRRAASSAAAITTDRSSRTAT